LCELLSQVANRVKVVQITQEDKGAAGPLL
jgi:hypothetical protein